MPAAPSRYRLTSAKPAAKAIVLRKPHDRRQIAEELDHILRSVAESKTKPVIVGFCCQYGLFGTGTLARIWRGAKAGVWIVPVLCVAKVEADHILRAFEAGAEGVFIAGCGEQCARENTAYWVRQRVEKVRGTLEQIGLERERVQAFVWSDNGDDLVNKLDSFTEQIGAMYLTSIILEEVKS